MSFNRFSPIDPATVPMISIVEIPDAEALIRSRLNEVKTRWSFYDPPLGAQYDVETLEFDPIKITMEAGAASEVNALSFVNAMGKATTLAFAGGADLDALASRYPNGVPRLFSPLGIPEEDGRYRFRIWLSSNSFSTAGSALAYVFQALTALPELRDATAIARRDSFEQEPRVIITCLLEGDEPRPTIAQLLKVRARVTDKGIGPLTDVVVVNAAEVIPVNYRIRIWFFLAADKAASLAAVNAALAELVDAQRYLGFSNTLAAIYTACSQYGISNVIIDEPGGDVMADETQVVIVKSITVDARDELAFPQNRIVVAGIVDSMEASDRADFVVVNLIENIGVLASTERPDTAQGRIEVFTVLTSNGVMAATEASDSAFFTLTN